MFYFSSMMAADTEKLATVVALHAPGFSLCLHGAAAGTGGAPIDTGGATTADTGGAV